MKLLKILLLATLPLTCYAVPPVTDEVPTHGHTYTVKQQIMVDAGQDIKKGYDLPMEVEGNTVWTGFKVCLLTLPGIGDPDAEHKPLPRDADVIVQVWVVNQDNGVSTQYYFNHEIESSKSHCSPREVLENPAHIGHKIKVFFRVYNRDERRLFIKLSLGAYSK